MLQVAASWCRAMCLLQLDTRLLLLQERPTALLIKIGSHDIKLLTRFFGFSDFWCKLDANLMQSWWELMQVDAKLIQTWCRVVESHSETIDQEILMKIAIAFTSITATVWTEILILIELNQKPTSNYKKHQIINQYCYIVDIIIII